MSLFEEFQKWNKVRCRDLGKKFELGAWSQANLQGKLKKIEELADFVSDQLGIQEGPIVAVVNLGDAWGAYDPEKNIVFLDGETLDKGGILTACTIAHEVTFDHLLTTKHIEWFNIQFTN